MFFSKLTIHLCHFVTNKKKTSCFINEISYGLLFCYVSISASVSNGSFFLPFVCYVSFSIYPHLYFMSLLGILLYMHGALTYPTRFSGFFFFFIENGCSAVIEHNDDIAQPLCYIFVYESFCLLSLCQLALFLKYN